MLLPTAERRGEIHFHVAKRLPYFWRLALAFSLMGAGLIIETALYDSAYWAGLPVVLAGVLLLVTRGYGNVVRESAKRGEWRPARREEIARIIELNARQRKWDQDVVDITCVRGVLALIGLAGVLLAAVVAMDAAGWRMSEQLVQVLLVNAGVMLLPFWFTGVRFILKNDQLVVKARILLELEDAFLKTDKREGEEFQYQIQTAEAKGAQGQLPHDVKAILAFRDAPPDFLGVQMQVSINSVQGKDYPYFYCVLVARPGFGGLECKRAVPEPRGIHVVTETKREADMDIAVIRQTTTKNSGYHTNQRAAYRVFAYALNLARTLLAEKH